MKPTTENILEESAIEILQSQGWEYANGIEISPEGLFCESESFSQIVLVNRLRNAFAKIYPEIALDAQEAAIRKVLRIASPDLLHTNEEFHRLLVEKIKIPYQQKQTYKAIVPSLFTFNAICILSDSLECKAGNVSADLSRYMTWRVCVKRSSRKTADGIKDASRFNPLDFPLID